MEVLRAYITSTKINAKNAFQSSHKITAALYGIVGIILSFVSWDDIGITDKKYRIAIFIVIPILSFIVSLIHHIFSSKKEVWRRGTDAIFICYGDIVKLGFAKRKKVKYRIAIPVNSDFDTVVGNEIVSAKTLHGQWINEAKTNGCNIHTIDKTLERALSANQESINLDSSQKPKGKRIRYPIGTIAEVRLDDANTTFYLFALSNFDPNMNAYSSKSYCIECIEKLIQYHNIHGQGEDLYIPLIVTGLSRVNNSLDESVDMILSVLRLHQEDIHCQCHVVVYNKERAHFSIHSL